MRRKRWLIVILSFSFLLLFSVSSRAKEDQENHSPVINSIYASKETVGVGESIEIIVEADDLDKDKLNYQWLADGGQIIGEGGHISYFPPSIAGSYKVTVIVADKQGGRVVANKRIDVINLEASLEVEKTLVHPGETIEVAARTGEFKGKLNYRWTTGYGNIEGEGEKVAYTAPSKEGLYNIRVLIRDEKGIELRRSIGVEVRNYLPKVVSKLVAKPNFITIAEQKGRAVLSLSAIDPNGDELTYVWSASEGRIIGQGERVTYISPRYSAIDTVKVKICDSYGGEVVEKVDIKTLKVWQRSYGGIGYDAFEAVAQGDVGYLAVGYTTSFNKDWLYPSGYIVGVDDNGKELFYNYDFFEGKEELFFTVSASKDGNYLLGGYKGNSNDLSNDGFVIKVDKKTGKKLADYKLDNTSNQQIYKIYSTDDREPLAVGYSIGIGNDGYLAKLKSNDKSLDYTYNYNKQGSNDYFNDIIATADKGYLLLGYTSFFGDRDGDGLLVKLDDKNNKVFEYTYGKKSLDERFKRIIRTEDGGYLLVGALGSTKRCLYDGYIVKVDSQGEVLFSNTYGTKSGDDGFRGVVPVDGGGYLLVGYSDSDYKGDYDGYVVKIDNYGHQEWAKTYGGIESDEFMDVIATNDGGYLLVGYTNSFSKGKRNAYIVKIDQEGKTGPNPAR